MSTEDDLDHVSQSIVSAHGAPPVATTGVASAFDMGKRYLASEAPPATEAPIQARPATTQRERAIQTLQACGPLQASQLAEAMGLTAKQASDLCCNGVRDGQLVRLSKEPGERASRFAVKGQASTQATGFHGWLKRKGQATAEGRTTPKKRAAQGARVTEMGGGEAPARPAPQAPAPDARWAMYSDGALVIERLGTSITLEPAVARQMLLYVSSVLDLVSEGVRA